MSSPRHDCPGHCGRSVRRDQLACRDCWYRLPLEIRRSVSAAYLDRARNPSAHRAAMLDAFEWYRRELAANQAERTDQ